VLVLALVLTVLVGYASRAAGLSLLGRAAAMGTATGLVLAVGIRAVRRRAAPRT